MNLFGLPEPAPRPPRKYTRTPSVIRLCWISEGDELCFADSAPMPEWRARALMAIIECYRGPLPPWLVSDLHDIADSDLPAGLRRSAVWLLRREAS